MRSRSMILKSNKKAVSALIWGVVIGAIITIFMVFFAGSLYKKIFSGTETITDCKTQQGTCYSTCDGDHAYQVFGATGCKKDEVCCRGKMLSDAVGDDPNVSNPNNACSDYDICYVSTHPDDSWKVAKNWYNGDQERNCYYLVPQYNKVEPKPAINGQVLSKGYENVNFTASATAKCCLIQIGGINKYYANNYFGYAYFNGDDKVTSGYIPYNETTGTCTATINFNFAEDPPNPKVFNQEVWKESFDDRTFCAQEDAFGMAKKAMFKVDFVYWNKPCKPEPGFLDSSANSVATLFDVAKFAHDKYGYNDDPTGSGNEPGNENYFVYLRNSVKPRLGGVGDPVCTTFCEKVTRGSDTPSGEGDSCEFVSFIEVDAGEDCPASKFEQVSKTDDLFYKQFYDDQIFVEGGDVKDYFVVDPSKKICLIGASGPEFFPNDFAPGVCQGIYYLNPNKDTPTEPCELDKCSSVKSQEYCNNIQRNLDDYTYQLDFRLYPDEYCDDLKCFYGTDGLFTFNKCRSCGVISSCSGYSKEDACAINPCKLGISPSLTGGCFWSTKGIDKCKQCPGSCEMLLNDDCMSGEDCNLHCAISSDTGTCVTDTSFQENTLV